MNKIMIFVLVGISCCMGCALKQKEKASLNANRIVYRDLTVSKDIKLTETDVRTFKPEYFVEFDNESKTGFDREPFFKYLELVDKEAPIVIFGHSHGNSSKGTLTLSSGRARVIRDIMIEKGYKNVNVMAFWSRNSVSYAPTKGVHLYVLDEANLKEIAIVIKKNKGAENEKVDPNQVIGFNSAYYANDSNIR